VKRKPLLVCGGPGEPAEGNKSPPGTGRHTRTPKREAKKLIEGTPRVNPGTPGPWKGERTPRSHCYLTETSTTEHVVHQYASTEANGLEGKRSAATINETHCGCQG
jgi:hypothetical protein